MLWVGVSVSSETQVSPSDLNALGSAGCMEKLVGRFTGQMSCNYSFRASPLAACQASQWRNASPSLNGVLFTGHIRYLFTPDCAEEEAALKGTSLNFSSLTSQSLIFYG